MNPLELAVLQAVAALLERVAENDIPGAWNHKQLADLRRAMRTIGWPVTGDDR